MICPDCFSELKRLHNFKVMAKQAEIFFELKRSLAPALKKYNEEAKKAQAAVVELSTGSSVLLVEPFGAQTTSNVNSNVSQARAEYDLSNKAEFRIGARMSSHTIRPSTGKKFFCSKCGYGFKTESELLKHSSATKIYKCVVCDGRFSCKLLLDQHRSEFHGNVFKCDKCSYQTKNSKYLVKHKGIHDKAFACETCQKKFATNENFKLHQMQHKHGIYSIAHEEFECTECGKTFSSSHHLKVHRRKIHVENEAKCEVCDKIFKNQYALHRHSLMHNKGECSICNKMISKYGMSAHLRTHSAVKIFKCDLCQYSAKRKDNLRGHMERMHLLKKLNKRLQRPRRFLQLRASIQGFKSDVSVPKKIKM